MFPFGAVDDALPPTPPAPPPPAPKWLADPEPAASPPALPYDCVVQPLPCNGEQSTGPAADPGPVPPEIV